LLNRRNRKEIKDSANQRGKKRKTTSHDTRMPGGQNPAPNCRFDGSIGVHSVAKLPSGTAMSPMRQLWHGVDIVVNLPGPERQKKMSARGKMQEIFHKVIMSILLMFATVLPNNHGQTIHLVEKELEKAENQIDIGYLCLLLSKDAFPDVDIEHILLLFDGMAKNVNIICETSKDNISLTDKRIGSLNTFLFRPGPWNAFGPKDNKVFSYDEKSDDIMIPKALFLPYMLETIKGTCSTMPTLWYILADRLGWPVNAVRGPGHIWVKYRGIIQDNIEVTSNGGYIADSQYIRDMQISTIALKNEIYLKPLSKKQFISTILVNNAYYCTEEIKDTILAADYLNYSIKFDSTNAEAIHSLGLLKKDQAMIKKAIDLGLSNSWSTEFYTKRESILK
jgi:hypothetical protein